jgi:hypothetical protein
MVKFGLSVDIGEVLGENDDVAGNRGKKMFVVLNSE